MERNISLFLILVLYLFPEVLVLRYGDVIRGKLIKRDEDTMAILAKYGELDIVNEKKGVFYTLYLFFKYNFSNQ